MIIKQVSVLFTKHPEEVGMSYLEHTRFALSLSVKTLGCALASLVHAFLPFLFVTYTSSTVKKLNQIFTNRENEILKIRNK